MNNSSDTNLIELASRVTRARPDLDPVFVSKALVKIRKLAKTLQNRSQDVLIGDASVYENNSGKFYRKVCELAKGIGCEYYEETFIPDGFFYAPSEMRYYLRINGVKERIL